MLAWVMNDILITCDSHAAMHVRMLHSGLGLIPRGVSRDRRTLFTCEGAPRGSRVAILLYVDMRRMIEYHLFKLVVEL